ncbi:MAG: metal ABC transporter permease [Christensenellales bacterium]
MIEILSTLFSYSFMIRALIAGTLVSLCAALLGVSLVLKRYSMIGDGLSHVGFGALSVATALNWAPMGVALPVVLLSAFLLLRLNAHGRVSSDAAIALVSSSSLAIGIIATSLAGGIGTDLYNYMFGSVLAMSRTDVTLALCLSAVVLILFVFFYQKIFAVTFDEVFAKATGLKSELYTMLIAALTAITIVIGMRIMGTLLISSLIIFPAMTSMRVFHSFRGVVISAALVSVLCFVFGLLFSFMFALPTGASVVLVNLVLFLLFSLYAFCRKHSA